MLAPAATESGPDRRHEVADLAAGDHAGHIAHGIEDVAGGDAPRPQLLADALLELVAVQRRAAGVVASRHDALQHRIDAHLELVGTVQLRRLEAVQPLHDARQTRLGVVERELLADLALRLLDPPDQARERRVLVVERELADDRGDPLAEVSLQVAVAVLELPHQAAEGAVGKIERELVRDRFALQLQRVLHLAPQGGDEGVAVVRAEEGAKRALVAQVLRQQLVERAARRLDLARRSRSPARRRGAAAVAPAP